MFLYFVPPHVFAHQASEDGMMYHDQFQLMLNTKNKNPIDVYVLISAPGDIHENWSTPELFHGTLSKNNPLIFRTSSHLGCPPDGAYRPQVSVSINYLNENKTMNIFNSTVGIKLESSVLSSNQNYMMKFQSKNTYGISYILSYQKENFVLPCSIVELYDIDPIRIDFRNPSLLDVEFMNGTRKSIRGVFDKESVTRLNQIMHDDKITYDRYFEMDTKSKAAQYGEMKDNMHRMDNSIKEKTKTIEELKLKARNDLAKRKALDNENITNTKKAEEMQAKIKEINAKRKQMTIKDWEEKTKKLEELKIKTRENIEKKKLDN